MTDAFATASNPISRSPRAIAVDNFLRKALRVSDPRDPSQIANALLSRYPEEAEKDRRERAGLPYASAVDYPTAPPAAAGAASIELEQARDDLERDLQTIANSSELKDIRVEMVGWGRAIRQIASDGLAAARLALDSVSHDRAMSARRSLYEYARLARYVGTLTEGSRLQFRRLAQSCDVLAGLVLVAIGEGLAANGITRSTALVRVAAGELQARRNAVLLALRSLTGSVEGAVSQEDWPRGLEAFRTLVQRLERAGQSDLRSLLEENNLAQAMDALVDLSTGASVDGLRELSTTSSLLVHRFQRLIQYGGTIPVPITDPIGLHAPESPPLAMFVSSLQLFVDAFVARGSSRLLFVARPAIITYGLYGMGGGREGAERLVTLTRNRSTILEQSDCLCGCCDEDSVEAQMLLDFIIYRLDQAIDLYAVGTDDLGQGAPERRAATAALVIDFTQQTVAAGQYNQKLTTALDDVEAELLTYFNPAVPKDAAVMTRELQIAFQSEEHTVQLTRSLTPACDPNAFGYVGELITTILHEQFGVQPGLPSPVQMPSPIASSVASMAQNRPDYWSDED
jgi:hypothetical protein